jgi:hypothetical protein
MVDAMSDADTNIPDPHLPPTFLREIGDRPAEPTPVFDPALKQYAKAFRLGGLPADTDDAVQAQWDELQRSRSVAVLRTLAASRLGAQLVLRGSWLLHEWFGDAARQPHDLDFVHTGDLAPEAFSALAVRELIADHECRRAGLLVDEIAAAAIWTYEKVEGQRLVVPWAVGHHNGVVQVDVTFAEEIPGALEQLDIAGAAVHTVSKETSLVWKLMWLLTDMYPQGKDLFDAVLLSRSIGIGPAAEAWLRAAVLAEWTGFTGNLLPDELWANHWEPFAQEYPHLAAGTSAAALREELARNLGLPL